MERPAVAINDMSDRYYISQCYVAQPLQPLQLLILLQLNIDFLSKKWTVFPVSLAFWILAPNYFLNVPLSHRKGKEMRKKSLFHLAKPNQQLRWQWNQLLSLFCQPTWHLFNPVPNALSMDRGWSFLRPDIISIFRNKMEFRAARNNLFEAI